MGQALAVAVLECVDLELLGIWKRGQEIGEIVPEADVVIDFSLPEGTERVLDAVMRCKKALVCGVSGLSESTLALLDKAAAKIPLVYDRNMSLGVAVLERAVREAAASLGPEYEVQVSEVHHAHKIDAPSGTALKLGEAIAAARGEPGTGAVRFEVERRGDVAGEHGVLMASATERLSFTHSVTTRQVFVDGALTAARWVKDKAPGRYSMQDVLSADLIS